MNWSLNWFGIAFSFGIPVVIIIGMTAALISDSVKKKRSEKEDQ